MVTLVGRNIIISAIQVFSVGSENAMEIDIPRKQEMLHCFVKYLIADPVGKRLHKCFMWHLVDPDELEAMPRAMEWPW